MQYPTFGLLEFITEPFSGIITVNTASSFVRRNTVLGRSADDYDDSKDSVANGLKLKSSSYPGAISNGGGIASQSPSDSSSDLAAL